MTFFFVGFFLVFNTCYTIHFSILRGFSSSTELGPWSNTNRISGNKLRSDKEIGLVGPECLLCRAKLIVFMATITKYKRKREC